MEKSTIRVMMDILGLGPHVYSLQWCDLGLNDLLQRVTRPIFWDETETKKLGLSKITTRPRPGNSGC